jgi:hypothetical protein
MKNQTFVISGPVAFLPDPIDDLLITAVFTTDYQRSGFAGSLNDVIAGPKFLIPDYKWDACFDLRRILRMSGTAERARISPRTVPDRYFIERFIILISE